MLTIPEMNKTPGLCYAVSPDGLELPVLDVRHPAFHVGLSEAELAALAQAYAAGQERGESSLLRRLFNRWVLPRILRGSRLGRGLLAAKGGYLDGLSTYLLKLGPAQLGQGYAQDLDRRISASFPGLSARLRLQDCAELMAQALLPSLLAAPGRPLHLVNIAGGPSMDSLNALLILGRDQARPLAGRSVRIHVLDLEADGAAFAAAALAALKAAEAPLQGLDLGLEHRAYDWNEPRVLAGLVESLPADAVLAFSSEGGLWDYAPDTALRGHFKILRSRVAPGTSFTGSLSRPDGAGQSLKQGSLAKLELRSLEDFGALAADCGWEVLAARQRPINTAVTLCLP